MALHDLRAVTAAVVATGDAPKNDADAAAAALMAVVMDNRYQHPNWKRVMLPPSAKWDAAVS